MEIHQTTTPKNSTTANTDMLRWRENQSAQKVAGTIKAFATWPLGEYRWDGAGGSFYFVDPQDDMLVVFMVQAPTQGGRIQLALKTMMFEALGKGLRKD